MLDVDKELWEVLDLCSDEELETIYDVLFGPSPFSPVVKSMVKEDEPPLLQLRGRTSIMHKVCAAKGTLAQPCMHEYRMVYGQCVSANVAGA
jgi:hypothetical protein